MGIFGWWFSGSILRGKTIREWQMKLYNMLVPIFKLIDKMMMNKVGLSVITFGTKNNFMNEEINNELLKK